ncbi:MAG: tRNA pseudouridine(55) synthase TruB [Candidatus Paceibacterota bacterium]|jgi:tRNA pseudouridine55 synthase
MDLTDILLVDKPKGITSFDVIRILRRELGVRKMGHAGTLDPLATGLLIIGVNAGTKKLAGLIGLPKTYDAEIRLGMATDSGDAAGTIVQELPVPVLTNGEIQAVVEGMKGKLTLPVSLFSAIKRDGVPLYKYAYKGEKVELPMRDMTVRDARFVSYENGIIRAVFDVSSGTYVRSLAEELGKRLGTCASILNLRRLSIGEYSVEGARKVS